MVSKLWQGLKPQAGRRGQRPVKKFQPGFELLEDRTVPSTYTVTTTGDVDAANPVPGGDANTTTLREAIRWANGNAGPDAILFNIAPGGLQTITLLSPLDPLTDSGTTIDGTTEPGYPASGTIGGSILAAADKDATGFFVGVDRIHVDYYKTPVIAIDANGAAFPLNRIALHVAGGASDITIKGLAIYNTGPGDDNAGAIFVSSTGTNIVVQDSFIGVLPNGADPGAQRNRSFGIQSSNTSTVTASHNYVGWNGRGGINGRLSVSSILVDSNEVFANGWNHPSQDGIDVNGDNSIVQGNLIYDNTATSFNGGGGAGIEVGSSDPGTNGQNLIDNNTVLNNFTAGIGIRKGNSNNTVSKNIVSGNYVGISVRNENRTPTDRNRLTQNSIFGNAQLGIDLNNQDGFFAGSDIDAAPAGVAFDGQNVDAGGAQPTEISGSSNKLQHFPIITTVVVSGGLVIISGTLNTVPDGTYTIELFSNTAPGHAGADGVLYGEGENYLGSVTVVVAGGSGSFTSLPLAPKPGAFFTATATDPSGNTSEFSNSLLLPTIDLSLSKTVDNATPTVGTNVIFTITVANAVRVGTATGVHVQDLLPAGLTFVTSTVSQGVYNSGTGDWDVGTLASAASATLTITATVTVTGPRNNFAEVSSANQPDADSVPNNDANPLVPHNEDDDDNVIITPVQVTSNSADAARIGGSVFIDSNDNGFRNRREKGIPGVLVTLIGVDVTGKQVVLHTRTNAKGRYLFTGVSPGVYVLIERQPRRFLDGRDRAGDRGGIAANDSISGIVLRPGDVGSLYFFGELSITKKLLLSSTPRRR